jgi:hypothetical protein
MGFILSLSVVFTSLEANSAFADFNFGAAGDFGCGGNAQSTLNNIKSHTTVERFLALGDYSYQNSGSCWLNMVDSSNLKTRTRIAIGNHEDDDSESYSQYTGHFGIINPYYATTYGNARIIVMDSDRTSFSSGSSQYNFVKSALQSAAADSNIKWIIVMIHKEFYTSPNTCGAGDCSNTHSTPTSLRNTYHPLFDQYGVDLVLNGHLHNYQRTYPIKYSGGSTPQVTSNQAWDYGDPSGAIFATVGTGGVNFHGLAGKANWVKYQQDDDFGSLDISIENNGYTLAGRYYANDGAKLDVFKLTKTGAAQYTFGPSLALSGEETSTTPTSGNTPTKNSLDVNNIVDKANDIVDKTLEKIPGLDNGKGLGLFCEHFKNKGPMRCRD